MKKIIAIILSVFVMLGSAYAVDQAKVQTREQIHEPGTGLVNESQPQQIREQDRDQLTVLPTEARARMMAHTPQELNEMIQQRRAMLNTNLSNMPQKMQNIYKNENNVRLAVHAMLAMENLTGGIGPQVSEIAKQFNNSVMSTINAEERIQNRGALARFFAGGDSQAADDIQTQITKNKERLQELKQLEGNCNCSQEVKTTLQEQIQNIETEQNRLSDVAQEQRNSKGIFGWIWK